MADDHSRSLQTSQWSRFMDSPYAEPSQAALTPPNRRLHPRHTAQVQIEIRPEGSGVPLRLETTDLSRGGCYVQMMMTLEIGARLQATLWLDGAPVIIHGRVVTRHPQFGNGIAFVNFEGQTEQALTRYLDAIDE
jgi:c-di-GMP-binding flagellar brake protein YcgR